MRNLNWTEKLAILFTLVLGASLLFQLFYVVPYLRNRDVERTQQRQRETAWALGRELQIPLQGAKRHILELSRRPEFIAMDRTAQAATLNEHTRSSALLTACFVLLPDFRMHAATADSVPKWAETIAQRCAKQIERQRTEVVVFADPRFAPDAEQVASAVAAPISTEGGETVGYLVAEIRLNELITTVANYRLDVEQTAFVVTQEGLVVAHSGLDALAPQAVLLSLDYGHQPLVRANLEGQHGQSGEYDVENVSFLGSSATLTPNAWIVVVETPKGVVFGRTNKLAWQLLLINVGLFGAAMAVSLMFTQQITAERAAAEEALWESKERFRNLFEESTDAVFIMDLAGKIANVNRTACRMLGYAKEDLLCKTVAELSPDGHVPIERSALDAAGTDEAATFESRLHKQDGAVISVEISAKMTSLQHDQIQAVVRDITERKRSEEQMRQTEKMQAIGQLAGGVAHDFNNLLMGILGEANMLRMDAKPGSAVGEGAEAIEQAASRAAELTSQLLGFARRGKHQIRPVDLHDTIREVVRLLGRTIGADVRIVPELTAHRSVVVGDPNQMQQVVMNLAINARDAMPDGGTLTIRTRTCRLPSPEADQTQELAPGQYCQILVTDTGTGMPEDVRARVFEPFFTTKEQGKGTGMGLATVYGIVQNHGGAIDLQSTVGEGTTFAVTLPCSTEDAKPETLPAGDQPEAVPGIGRIMLVDDEQIVLKAVGRMLQKLGYEPTAAGGGAEAAERYREHGQDIDLVIIDVGMPEMDGYACFRALKELDPDVRVLLSSGYAPDGKAQAAIEEGVLGFVQKPYRMNDLGQKIAEALSGEAGKGLPLRSNT